MRRLALLTTLAVALALPAGASATTPAVAPTTAATLDACHTSADALARYAIFTAQMGSVDGTTRMQARFDVQGRSPSSRRYRPLVGPGLGRWRTSMAGVGRFVLHRQVVNLPAGGDVRALVSFRWIGAGGAIIRKAHLRTPVCRVADVRPDLVIDGLSAQPGDDAGHLRYVVAVRNAGLSDAGAFDVALSVAGATQSPQTIGGLIPGERRVATFTGPRCNPGDAVQVTLDPGNRIDEAVERDDTRLFGCPTA